MQHVTWNQNWNTGIQVIDAQHHRIVHYINQLRDAIQDDDRTVVEEVLDDLVDYTLSHFAFEESLQAQAEYEYFDEHKKTHDRFAGQVADYQARVVAGEDVTRDLLDDLQDWLINHITHEDMNYVSVAKEKMPAFEKGWVSKTLQRVFR
jgi:hemerythrin